MDFNRYAYAGNDPINGSDPNGHVGNKELSKKQAEERKKEAARQTHLEKLNFQANALAHLLGGYGQLSSLRDRRLLSKSDPEVAALALSKVLFASSGTVNPSDEVFNLIPGKFGVTLTAKMLAAGFGIIAVKNAETTLVKDLIATQGLNLGPSAFKKLYEDVAKNGVQDPVKYAIKNGEKYVVDGHHRLDIAKRLGLDSVPTQQVDLPFAGYTALHDLEPFYPSNWMK